jgi:hypothetical protein
MVKNTVGGCKSKKLARKMTSGFSTKKEATRFSTNELEQYAVVTKIYGNGRCQIKTHGGLDLQCVIRNKFKGRSKRGNVVTNGAYLLVGLREWETSSGFKTCDLMEIYDNEDVAILNNVAQFKTLVANTTVEKHTEDGLFSMDAHLTEEDGGIKPTATGGTLGVIAETEEEGDFDFDDI